MNSQTLINKLGYEDNPSFLKDDDLKLHHGYSFFFEQARKDCDLKGVYVLTDLPEKENRSITPLVYVCEAENDKQAVEIHRRVWNQNIVPFLVVVTRGAIRLYSGFEFDRDVKDEDRVLGIAKNTNEILTKLADFKARTIDSGAIWDSQSISSEGRVDRKLLANLKSLSKYLTDDGLIIEDAHSLIGKYIYLKYLRDRDILSDRRLEDAGFTEDDIFGRNAKKGKLYELEGYLNDFLNGSVFPLPNKNKIKPKHIQKVADVFMGGNIYKNQSVLFDMYDFSYVPIETLSVVYQQFLHQKEEGKSKGAFYTPVHLVNFVLDELEAKKPLQQGMKIFDPSCGSGAFLVQCYRRLVESVLRARDVKKLKTTELRELLVNHIYGLDADCEACQVAQLSLSLTLLDYIDPPDLTTTSFKLPDLRDTNVFYCEGGFFDEGSAWAKNVSSDGYDWIVGNPPWKAKYDQAKSYDVKALAWIKQYSKQYPVGKEQLAEAFAWKVSTLLAEDGQCGLVMPALSLFKKTGIEFRRNFFTRVETWCVVNFANLRHRLFEGAGHPAAAFFFSGKKEWDKDNHYITTYAPFAVEDTSLHDTIGKQKKVWSVAINYAGIKDIQLSEVISGDSILWKNSMWGTIRDQILVSKVTKRMPSLEEYTKKQKLHIGEGMQIRMQAGDTELANEVKGKKIILMNPFSNLDNPHHLPPYCFDYLSNKKNIYARKGRKENSLRVCKPPHIFIDAARRFAIYSDDFFVIPPRQIGISGDPEQKTILKVFALYLKSDFAIYQQWLTSASWGVERDRPNLDDLKRMPVPLASLSDSELSKWAKLHDDLVEIDTVVRLEKEKDAKQAKKDKEATLFDEKTKSEVISVRKDSQPILDKLLAQMNDMVYKLMGINKKQRWLIEDMLNVKMKLNNGKIADEAIKTATKREIEDFAKIFQGELDLFLDHSGKKKVHKLKVMYTDKSVVMIVDHLQRSKQSNPEVVDVSDSAALQEEMEKLKNKLLESSRSQWIYYTRCLRIYEGRKTYIFKPRERLYWLKSQALAEADDFIEEKLATV